MRYPAAVLAMLLLACGGEEQLGRAPDAGSPPEATMVVTLKYQWAFNGGCGQMEQRDCVQSATMPVSKKASLTSRYSSCAFSGTDSVLTIDCRSQCLHSQAWSDCLHAYFDFIQCPAVSGTPGGAGPCGWSP